MIALFRRSEPPRGLDALDAASWWLARLTSGKATAVDRQNFDAWRNAAAENAAAFNRVARFWKGAEALASEPVVLEVESAALDSAPKPDWRAVGIAASVVLVLIGGIALKVFQGNANVLTRALPDAISTAPRPDSGSFATAVGERSTITLADGSVMTLDTDSAATVAYAPDVRAIHLTRGRALFEVAKNKEVPFIVEAGDRKIVAVGTMFDVRLDRAQVEVTLVEGNVVVNPATAPPQAGTPAAQQTARLQPGERLVAKQGEVVTVSAANVEQATSWRDGHLVFLDQNLGDAVMEMNRYTRAPIVLEDEKLAALSINGVFRAGQPSEFARALMNIYPVTVRQQDSATVIGWKTPH